MWLTRLSTVFLVASGVGSSPLQPRGNGQPHMRDITIVTGVQKGKNESGSVPVRREIHDLKASYPDQWNVYILGLRAFQLADQTDPKSFYQIAGIHGRPYVAWEGAEGIPEKRAGYCPHTNTMFFGWHRAYLALYEQELYKHVQNVAWQFPSHLVSRYTSAAEDFRVPYWDWALGEAGGPFPDFFTSPIIQVIGTSGKEETVSNPLHHFEFHPNVPGDFEGRYSGYNTTLRWPTSDKPSAQSQDSKLVDDFNGQITPLHDAIGRGFGIAKNMNEFVLTHVEVPHGWVHFTIGGGKPRNTYDGHMWPLDYSAFEPLFMLHHCNVDRIFALWQAANPDKYVEPKSVGYSGTFTIPDKTIVDADTPLSPFWNTPNTFWTTNGVRDTTVLGYAYPETKRWTYESPEKYKEGVNAAVANLYSASARARLTGNAVTGGDLKHINADNSFMDWSINMQASPVLLPGTLTVRFSLIGEFSSDPVAEVGAWHVLIPENHEMERRKVEQDSIPELKLKGTVSLTASLLDDIAAGKLESLNQNQVLPYLKQKLTWKVYAANGTVIPHGSLQGLTIDVVSIKVSIPDDPNLPLNYSNEPISHSDVMFGRGGGTKA
ncbi:Di-copper centre-containing protein [Zopfia rhizophila CBS 207.26]|uniref:tyrosinase n=1 Tax=Zopfia rhizophila CBS 207.26 TaxID=1314779 RepID=A0A6A6E5D0_9PEZI|nr:Di-copper centre-containing protein [Zopfia rhizophila CBS 207.26]